MRISPARYRQVTIVALVALAAIIVSGAVVRLTGSGLGCEDWPRCSENRFIDVSSGHTAIEQLNRLFSAAIGIPVLAVLIGALRRTGPRRPDLIGLSVLILVGTLANAVLGGISVRVDLHPMLVQGHMLLSMGLIVAGLVLVRRAGEPDGVPRAPVVGDTTRYGALALFGLTAVAVTTGTIVTGAGPHAGDERAVRLDIMITTAVRIHAVIVWLAVLVALYLVWRLRGDGAERRQLSTPLTAWVVAAVAQGAIGYIQYFTGVPVILVAVHVTLAVLVMLAATWVALDTTRPVAAAPARSPLAGTAPTPVA